MNLAQFERRRYTNYQTPIEFLPHLSEMLAGPKIYIKRDDLLGLSGGGNKTRKLEFLMADALKKGADTIITCGAVQSNHCRLTLSAAIKEGLKCHFVLEEKVAGSYNKKAGGNNFLYHLLGVDDIRVVPGGSDINLVMQETAHELRKEGRTPYIIPEGGSNETGSLGYVACAMEIMNQLFEMNLSIDHIYTASGSAGTHAGLLAGLILQNAGIDLTGVSVLREKEKQIKSVYDLARQVLNLFNSKNDISLADVAVTDDYIGEGYSLPTDQMIEAVKLLAKKEGILLDPVYTGKAMAGMIDDIRKNKYTQKDKLLFIHTGGAPALYGAMDLFMDE